MEGKALYSIILNSDNEKLNKAYEAYLKAKEELEKCLYYEGIIVKVNEKDAASGN
ncbi:hypothetical protein [Clostridium thermosuccinogenes]|uniref:hypothetical protein n=1 Tax=Clostridium thermosuccinogenes TaxID=84032 RepID=UPI00137B8BEC|nr:hypothetical protein [Pseudoclostridium thermosuccinogenes]